MKKIFSFLFAVAGITIFGLLGFQAYKIEMKKQEQLFIDASDDIIHSLSSEFRTQLNFIPQLRAFYASSYSPITREQFRQFVEPAIATRPALQALEWIPRVPKGQREQIEQAARAEGLTSFQISEQGHDNQVLKAGDRDFYYPVLYAEPVESNKRALGFDLGSSKARLDAIETAASLGDLSVTDPVRLVQDTEDLFSVLVFLAVYKDENSPQTLEATKGLLLGVYRIKDLVDSAIQHTNPRLLGVKLQDITNPRYHKGLYTLSNRGKVYNPVSELGIRQHDLLFGNRIWRITCYQTPESIVSEVHLIPWAIFLIGSFLSINTVVWVSILRSKTDQVAQEVKRKTKELVTSNEKLVEEISHRETVQAELIKSTTRFKAVVQTAQEAFITANYSGIIEEWNPCAERIFGYTPDEIIGKNLETIFPNLGENFHQTLTRTQEWMCQKKDGGSIPVSLSISRWDAGEQSYYTVILRDVTEQQDKRALLLESLKQARQASKATSNFLAAMSHELNTPLNGVIGFASCLKSDLYGETSDEQKEVLEKITQAGKHLTTLIGDILEISTIQANNLEIHNSNVDVCTITKECIDLVTMQAENKQIELNYFFSDPVIIRMADERRLKQVLLNLLSNAIKFTSEGSITVEVLLLPDKGVEISVRDTGIGISEQQMQHIFKPFTQADPSITRKFGGTGLGLSISKHLVEGQGGTISAFSELGKGSTFLVALPYQEAEELRRIPSKGPNLAPQELLD